MPFVVESGRPGIPPVNVPAVPLAQARHGAKRQGHDAVFQAGVVDRQEGTLAIGAGVPIRTALLRIAQNESRVVEAARAGTEQRDESGQLPPFDRRQPVRVRPDLGKQAIYLVVLLGTAR